MCRNLTDAIHPGLDVHAGESDRSRSSPIGDTVLIQDKELAGFAVCHTGAGSEAGGGRLLRQVLAPRQRVRMRGAHFGRLLDACQSFAAQAGAPATGRRDERRPVRRP